MSSTQMSASITKTPRGNSRQSTVAARKANAAHSERTTAAKMLAASRAPAYRHTPRYRPKPTKNT